jgi:hypothetical protein
MQNREPMPLCLGIRHWLPDSVWIDEQGYSLRLKLVTKYERKIHAATGERRQLLLCDLAVELLKTHMAKRIALVRGPQDIKALEDETRLAAGSFVWPFLSSFRPSERESGVIESSIELRIKEWIRKAWDKLSESLTDIDYIGEEAAGIQVPRACDWGDIEIIFLSDERIQIKIGPHLDTKNYAEMGFGSKKNGTPLAAWVTLRELARSDGALRLAADSRGWTRVEKRIQEIGKVFRSHFGLPESPFTFTRKTRQKPDDFGYYAKFAIRCHASYDF